MLLNAGVKFEVSKFGPYRAGIALTNPLIPTIS
jgi:hypothetical protein